MTDHAVRLVRHRLAVEVPTDEVRYDAAAASLADRLAKSVPQVRSEVDAACGAGLKEPEGICQVPGGLRVGADPAPRQLVDSEAGVTAVAEEAPHRPGAQCVVVIDGYHRRYTLTDFGWQVYRQHRLIIHWSQP